MKQGYIHYTVISPTPQRLFSRLKAERIELLDVTQSDTVRLNLYVSFWQRKRFERILAECNCEFESGQMSGILRIFRFARERAGLFVGGLVCAAAILLLKSFVVSIEVLTDDEKIRSQVITLLDENGVGVGTYIPSVTLRDSERLLKKYVDGISWAGISVADSTLIVDVIENIEEPEQRNERMPSNLVAAHNAVIEDFEVYNGELVKTIGSGVVKGEIIVSGSLLRKRVVENDGEKTTEEYTKYVRSQGKIYGTYTETQTFEQAYKDTRLILSDDTRTKNYLCVFGVQIPLFFKDLSGFYTESEAYKPFEILGVQTPIGIQTNEYTAYSFESVLYTKEQACELVGQAEERYEKNFLSEPDCTIKSKNTEIKYTENGVTLTAEYELYGVISEEVQFFAAK